MGWFLFKGDTLKKFRGEYAASMSSKIKKMQYSSRMILSSDSIVFDIDCDQKDQLLSISQKKKKKK